MKNFSRAKKIIHLYDTCAMALSVLLHPLLIPTYTFILIGYFSPLSISPLNTIEGRYYLIGLIFISSFLMPLLLIILYFMLKYKKWEFKLLLLQEGEDRLFPFLITGTFYTIIVYYLRMSPYLNDLVVIIMTIVSISIVTVALISKYFKISAHSVAISGMIGMIAVINNTAPDSTLFYPIVILILLAGLLFSARLYLNAHTPKQVFYGFLMGVSFGVIGLTLL